MRRRILGVLATAAAFAGLVGAAATPASAASNWIDPDQVLSITNPKTALSKDTPAGTVQVRYGTYGGGQYGWGRAVSPTPGYNLIFEVDTNGNRVADRSARVKKLSGKTVWTHGYPTSSSSKVAFRACITRHDSCAATNSEHRTGWW